jgi:hypothetical protein
MPFDSLSLAVVGVAFPNPDGSNRRTYIMLCEPGDPVHLVTDPKNPKDPNAVAVFSERGGQLGYVTAERAPLIRSWILAGREVRAIFQDTATWGAIVRVGLDGVDPVLPAAADDSAEEDGTRDDGFWPDEIYPDD